MNTGEKKTLLVIDRALEKIANIRSRLASCEDLLNGWSACISSGTSNDWMIQFHRPQNASGDYDFTLDIKPFLRALSSKWVRVADKYVGWLRDIDNVKIIIHNAEPGRAHEEEVQI